MLSKALRRIKSGAAKIKPLILERVGWRKYVAGLIATIVVGLVPVSWVIPPAGAFYTIVFLVSLYFLGDVEP